MKKLVAIVVLLLCGLVVADAPAKVTKHCHGTCSKSGCSTGVHKKISQTRVCAPCNDIFCNF